MGPGRILPHLEEGKKRIRGSGKTADFKPATFREFRNVSKICALVPNGRRDGTLNHSILATRLSESGEVLITDVLRSMKCVQMGRGPHEQLVADGDW